MSYILIAAIAVIVGLFYVCTWRGTRGSAIAEGPLDATLTQLKSCQLRIALEKACNRLDAESHPKIIGNSAIQ